MNGRWDMVMGEDRNLVFQFWGLKEECVIDVLELISKYLVLFEEEFEGDYNIDYFTIETQLGEPDFFQFYTTLPYCYYANVTQYDE